MSNSLWPHGLQHASLPRPSLSPRVYLNSCPLIQWCHPTHLSLCYLLLPSFVPSIRVFPSELVLCFRWPNDWGFTFSISPSNEYSGLISFKIDWLDLLAGQGTFKSLPQYHSSKASTFWHSAFFILQLSHPYMLLLLLLSRFSRVQHDYWKNHSLD